MDDTVKTLRFLNQLLLLFAAGVFLLGATADPARDYNAALDELAALRKVADSVTDYGRYIHDRLGIAQPSDNDLLPQVAREAGASMAGASVFKQPFACDCVPPSSSLTAYEAFLSGTRTFAPIRINDIKKLAAQLRDQIATQIPHSGFSFARVVFQGDSGSYELPDGTPVIRLRRPATYEGTLQFTFMDPQSKQRPSFSAVVFISLQEGQFALDWLRSNEIGRQLVDPRSSIVFPRLKRLSFWNRISPLGIDQAVTSVQAQLDHIQTGTVSFLGISVDKAFAVWLGPSVCLAILLYFLLHLRHFLSLANWNQLHNYPWVPFFPDVLSGVFSYCSVLFIPTLANVFLLCRYGQWNQLSAWVGLAATTGIAVFGAWTSVLIHKLREESSGNSA